MRQNKHFPSFFVGKKKKIKKRRACCREKPTVKGSERQLAAANLLVNHRCAEQLLP